MCPGSLAVLRLRGPEGDCDLYTAYLPTGVAAALRTAEVAEDLHGPELPSDELPDDASLKAQRKRCCRRLAQPLQPEEAVA